MGRKICNYTLAILFLLSGYAFAGDKVTGNETVSGTLAVTGASTLSGGATVGSLNGIVKASGGALGTATADTDYSVPNGVETLTNKTYDTGGTGNVFKIGGVSITGLYGNTAKLIAGSGTLTSGTCAQFDASGNVVTTGSSCASSGSVLGGSIIGTSNEVSVSSNSNTIGSDVTLSLPQAIATGSSPTFAGLTLSGLTASVPVFTGSGKALASGSISGNTTELATVTGSLTTGDFAYFDASGNVKDSGDSASTFAPATSGQAILYGNNSGGFSNVTIGTGLSFSGGSLTSTVTSQFVPNNIQVFTSSGTWTKPAGVSNVYVKVWGGGGGGTYGNSTGNSGGTSSFAGSSTIQATGGGCGQPGGGGSGGSGSGGNLNLSGQGGGSETAVSGNGAGLGGTPPFCIGGPSGVSITGGIPSPAWGYAYGGITGGFQNSGTYYGGAGGAGGYSEGIVTVTTNVAVTVGSGGTGVGGSAGNGGSGLVIVYY